MAPKSAISPVLGSAFVRLNVRLFGTLRESVGTGLKEFEVPDSCTVEQLRPRIAEGIPALAEIGDRVAVSVNFEVAPNDRVLREGDEIALLPPVSGGTGACSISAEPLVEADVVARVVGRDAGGVVTFVGAVRDHARGREIDYLEYEAYPEMAVREMEKIVEAAGKRWPGTRVAIAHRTGRLEIGEAAVIIVAVSAHRAEAFEACRFSIDTLKATVPIWKKEVTPGGEYWVDDRA